MSTDVHGKIALLVTSRAKIK